MSALPTIVFAPVLKAEQWISIDLQQQNILEALRDHCPDLRVKVLSPPERFASQRLVKVFVREMLYPSLIRRACAQDRSCLLHVGDHSYGHLCAAHQPSIINCNDVHHLVRPGELSPVSRNRWLKRVGTLQRATRVLTISHALRDEVLSHLPLDQNQVVALPGGIDHAVFHPSADDSFLPELRHLHGSHHLILNIGSNIERKNMPTLLRAVRQLQARSAKPVKLIKIGNRLHESHGNLIKALDLSEHVIDLGFCTPPVVAAACRLCDVLSFPSLYEGFGRPTIEAQACGLPTVLADNACMREVGGDAALYHRPEDAGDLAHQLALVLNDHAQRAPLVEAGLRNAARFSWANYARRLRAIYAEIATLAP